MRKCVLLTDAEISMVVSTIAKAVEDTFALVNKARKRTRTASGDAAGAVLIEDEHAMLDLASKSANSPFKNFWSQKRKNK